MAKNNKLLGNLGEDLAVSYLLNENILVLQTNYYKRCGEIDIIGKENDTILFIEVKFRTSTKFGHPLESIDTKKIEKIYKTANCYLEEKNLLNNDIRFDVVSILAKDNNFDIEYIKNAF